MRLGRPGDSPVHPLLVLEMAFPFRYCNKICLLRTVIDEDEQDSNSLASRPSVWAVWWDVSDLPEAFDTKAE